MDTSSLRKIRELEKIRVELAKRVKKLNILKQETKEKIMSATSSGRTIMVQGRIVWTSGDLFKGKPKTDMNTRQPVMDQRTGQQKVDYGFGLAVPKGAIGEIWNAIHEEAFTLYPNRQLPPQFAMKYKDGDGIDHNGASFALREGHAGHLVFACTTSLPIKFYKYENGQNILINEGIKCGDYVNVQLSIKAHPAQGQGKPGLYLNPMAVQLLGYGQEIVNAPSGDQIFGLSAPAVPQGASATPIAPTGFIVPTGAPQQAFNPPTMPQQQAAAPHYGVLPPVHQPAQMPGMPPMGNGQTGYAPTPAQAPQYGSPQQAYAPAAPAMPQQQPVTGMPPLPGRH
jgi:hypothetical protein